MSSPNVHVEGAQVVVLGHFNPAIFSPGWLVANGLIGRLEGNDARPQAIVPQLSIFEVGWLRCEVTPDRMSIATQDPQEFERVRDVAAGVLGVLPHVPVSAVGINRYFHVALPDQRAWHKVGDALAPKGPWESVLALPGMQDVTVRGVRPDNYAGAIQVIVQPSSSVRSGLFILHNDHYVLREVSEQPKSRDDPKFQQAVTVDASADLIPMASKILNTCWSESMKRAGQVLEQLWDLGTSGP